MTFRAITLFGPAGSLPVGSAVIRCATGEIVARFTADARLRDNTPMGARAQADAEAARLNASGEG
jgi:hypothetical protein